MERLSFYKIIFKTIEIRLRRCSQIIQKPSHMDISFSQEFYAKIRTNKEKL